MPSRLSSSQDDLLDADAKGLAGYLRQMCLHKLVDNLNIIYEVRSTAFELRQLMEDGSYHNPGKRSHTRPFFGMKAFFSRPSVLGGVTELEPGVEMSVA